RIDALFPERVIMLLALDRSRRRSAYVVVLAQALIPFAASIPLRRRARQEAPRRGRSGRCRGTLTGPSAVSSMPLPHAPGKGQEAAAVPAEAYPAPGDGGGARHRDGAGARPEGAAERSDLGGAPAAAPPCQCQAGADAAPARL